MARELGDVDEFLKYKASEGGGGGYLDRWKKNEPPRIDVWLHCTGKPFAVWQHNFPARVEYEKNGTRFARTFTKPLNCWETDKTLQNQHKRDRVTRARLFPPESCPICKLLEWVRQQVLEEGVELWAPLFKFKAPDDPEEVLVTFGGYAGLVNDKFLSKEELAAAAKHGLSPADSWMEKGAAKLNYLFRVVNNAHPEDGVQKTTETGLLGEKVQEVISKAIEKAQCAKDPKGDMGNPWKNPYAIRWSHNPAKGLEPSKKYNANDLPNVPLTPEIEELIRGEAPSIENDIAPLNAASLRATMERHCQVDGVPWDDIFSAPQPDSGDDSSSKGETPKPAAKVAPKASPVATKAPPPREPEVDMVACDNLTLSGEECGELMRADYDGPCPKCGAGGAEPAPPPPPVVKKRSAAKAEPPKAAGQQVGGKRLPF